jgi:hypothetical protein
MAPENKTRALVAVASILVVGASLVLVSRSGADHAPGRPSASPSRSAPTAPTTSSHPTAPRRSATGPPIFAIYYLWWDRQHWLTRLGSAYPASASPDPLPATLDGSSCSTVSNYPGNQLTDVSQGLGYDQSRPETILNDVELAARSGLAGFIVNWIGTGRSGQSVTSSNFNQRLKYMFDAVHQVNAAGTPFSLILNYQSSARLLLLSQFSNDFRYFLSAYGGDEALDHTYSAKPEVVMAGTWKYRDSDIESISAGFRSQMYLIGDEKPASWDETRARSLDGTSYYWSSQDPLKNKSSFAVLASFADTVRKSPNPDGSQKTWLAPFTPGYNAMLLYNTPTCVPRNNGATMQRLLEGNAASKPAGWTLISWNEISEGSYVVPLTRYGTKYTDTLRVLARSLH